MKILAAGDIHGDMGLAERLAIRAEEEAADVVILCGDLTLGEQSTSYLIGPFKKRNKKVLLIPGNHETNATADFLAKRYDVKNIHGYAVTYGGVGIFGGGGANIGMFRVEEDELFNLLKDGFERIQYLEKKVMVTHVHPKGSWMESFSRLVPGSSGVTKALETFSPDVLLCSHVHEAEGLEEQLGNTRVINVGREGKLIDL